MNSNKKKKAIFLDRDGVINKEIDYLHRLEDFLLYPWTGKAIKKINESDYLSVVVTNQSIIARNMCSINNLLEIHHKMESLIGNYNAKLDAIYFCPHHPDVKAKSNEFQIECVCRKPKIGMIKKAEKDLSIDTSQSYIIGDSKRDIICGKNAGMKTIAVRSGHGCKEKDIFPDYFFENLKEAVDFIIDEPYKKFFNIIEEKILISKKKPFVINIGGNRRSGKSTLASYLKQKFEYLKRKTILISLDNWLLPEDIKNKKKFYKEEIKKIEKDIIIIKGVSGISQEELRELSDMTIFCKIDENTLYERILNFYLWKGITKEKITMLFEKRIIEEYKIINKDEKYGNLIIHGL